MSYRIGIRSVVLCVQQKNQVYHRQTIGAMTRNRKNNNKKLSAIMSKTTKKKQYHNKKNTNCGNKHENTTHVLKTLNN